METLKKKAYILLRKSEPFTKTDMVYLTKGGFWLVFSQAMSTLFSFVLAVAFSRLVSKEVYGNYKYILSLGSVLTAFSLTGIASAITQAVVRGYDGALRQGFKESLRWSFFIIIGSCVAGVYYILSDNATLGISFFIIGSFTPILNSSMLFLPFLNGKKEFRKIAIYNIWESVVPATAMLGTLFFTQNIIILVFSYFVSNSLIAYLLYRRTLSHYKPSNLIDARSLPFGKHVSLLNILGVIGDKIDSLLLFHFFGGSTLAVYTFATAIPNQIIGVFKNIGLLVIPRYANRDLESIKHELYRKMARLAIVLAIMVVLYYFLAPYFFSLFFPQYIEAVSYSRLYSLIFIITSGVFHTSVLESKMAVKEKYLFTISSNTLRIVLMSLLVVPFGIAGIIYAQIITKTLMVILAMILVHKLKD